jgi:hypothetical protein
MRRTAIIGLLALLPLLPGCYVQRYFQIKKQYEEFQKSYSKVRRTNNEHKARQKVLNDSIALFTRKTKTLIRSVTAADSMIEVNTLKIREQLGNDPWSDSIKFKAREAAKADFMNEKEEDVIYWLNLARKQPDLYAEMYVDPYMQLYEDEGWLLNGTFGSYEGHVYYENSAYLGMATMASRVMLTPCKKCYLSADCHATESGKTGYVGHDRTSCDEYFSGECCYYGRDDGFYVIQGLIIDWGVPSLGHRRICLGSYSEIGVAIRPHTGYGTNSVLDFR